MEAVEPGLLEEPHDHPHQAHARIWRRDKQNNMLLGGCPGPFRGSVPLRVPWLGCDGVHLVMGLLVGSLDGGVPGSREGCPRTPFPTGARNLLLVVSRGVPPPPAPLPAFLLYQAAEEILWFRDLPAFLRDMGHFLVGMGLGGLLSVAGAGGAGPGGRSWTARRC